MIGPSFGSLARSAGQHGALSFCEDRLFAGAVEGVNVSSRPPWNAEETDACFIVKDSTGRALAYAYYEEEPGRRPGMAILGRGAYSLPIRLKKQIEASAPLREAIRLSRFFASVGPTSSGTGWVREVAKSRSSSRLPLPPSSAPRRMQRAKSASTFITSSLAYMAMHRAKLPLRDR